MSPGRTQDQPRTGLVVTEAYLTPALVSDHLFNPQGSKITIAPKIIIAYTWDIISIDFHLRFHYCAPLRVDQMSNKISGQNGVYISKMPIICKANSYLIAN
jgi:hypothetical protein